MKRLILTVIILLVAIIMGSVVIASTGITTTDDLNVRDGTDTSSNKIGTISKGSKVNIIDKEGTWYKIQYNNNIGYVTENYINIDEISSANVIEKSEDDFEESDEDKNSDSVNSINQSKQKLEKQTTLYILPLINSLKLSTLEEGTEVNIISNNGKWLYIQTDKESGWITSNMHFSEAKIEQKNKKEDEEESNEQSNTVNEVTNITETKNEVVNNTTVENSTKNETVDNESSEYPKTMYVSVDSANIRKSPSSTGEVVSGTARGESIKVIGKEGDWYKVSNEDGIGYIRSDLLSAKKN